MIFKQLEYSEDSESSEKKTLVLKKGEKVVQDIQELRAGTQDVELSWTCDQFVIVEEKLERLPKDLDHVGEELHYVDILENKRESENTDPIGSLKTMETSFAIDQDAEQVAIEFYIPSAYRFVATVSSDFV